MFSANCDQCGASNEFPASAQKDGINAGSLIHCPHCGKELRVRLTAEDSGDRLEKAVASESLGEPVGEAIVPNDELGDDEATQVLEWGSLPDAAKRRVAAPPDDAEPMTLRRKNGSTESPEARHTPTSEAEASALAELSIEAAHGIEATPESLVPLSERDFIASERPGRNLPLPPTRGGRAALRNAIEEAPVSAGSPPLAALVRKAKATPHPPRRDHHEPAAPTQSAEADEAKPGALNALVPPADPADEQWDAPLPASRPPTETEAPVASLSRPPEAAKPAPRSGGTLGFLLLVAGVAFVAGMAVKNAKDGESTAPAIPAAAPIAEAKPVDPIPQPVVEEPTPAPAPQAAEQPSETPAIASPPPALAAPDNEPRRAQPTRTVHAARVSSAEQPSNNQGSDSGTASSTVLPVRSANVATDAPPPEVAFDSEATTGALNAAAQRASSCRKQNDPSGVAVVTITFAPSGRVTSANISGPPFAGTETGSCIASVLRSVKVPAYSGDFMTVRKTINVQ